LIISLGNRRIGCIFGNKSQRQSIAQVCGLSLCTTNQPIMMAIITAKQNAPETFVSATDWMGSFVHSQISKLEELSENIPVGINATLWKTNQEPMWN
jgi:hypothetical protein